LKYLEILEELGGETVGMLENVPQDLAESSFQFDQFG
jgi:hypothetical protein